MKVGNIIRHLGDGCLGILLDFQNDGKWKFLWFDDRCKICYCVEGTLVENVEVVQ